MCDGVPPPLLLFWDVNQTVLLEDSAGNKTLEESVHCAIADAAYGRARDGQWELDAEAPLRGGPGKLSYYEWLRAAEPSRAARRRLTRCCADVGQPCAALRVSCFDAVLARLEPGRMLLPSFWAALETWAAQGRQVTLVFRTFGDDLGRLLPEYNARATAHPALRCFAIGADDRALLHRFDRSESGTVLVQPAHEGSRAQLLEHGPAAPGVVAAGLRDVARVFGALGSRAMAVQDHYDHWAAAGEADDAGKPLLVDPAAPTHPLFIDDNLWPSARSRRLICDVRELPDAAPLHYDDANDLWFHHVSPLRAALEVDYFVQAVALAELVRVHRARLWAATAAAVDTLWPWLDQREPQWRTWALARCCTGAGHRCCLQCLRAWVARDGVQRQPVRVEPDTLACVLALASQCMGRSVSRSAVEAVLETECAPVWVAVSRAMGV